MNKHIERLLILVLVLSCGAIVWSQLSTWATAQTSIPGPGSATISVTTANGALESTLRTVHIDLGAPGDAVCATDTGTCAIAALIKRTNARLTSLIATDFSTSAKQDTGNTSLANLEAYTQCIRPAVATESVTDTATTSTAVDAGCTGNAYWAQISNLDRTVDVVVTTPDGGSFNLGPLRTSPRICKASAATPDNFTVTSVDGSSLVSVIAGCAS